jgi:hypothetical protein
MSRKTTNLLQKGKAREHRRWRVENLETWGRIEANELKKKNRCFERERERENESCGTSLGNLRFEKGERKTTGVWRVKEWWESVRVDRVWPSLTKFNRVWPDFTCYIYIYMLTRKIVWFYESSCDFNNNGDYWMQMY